MRKPSLEGVTHSEKKQNNLSDADFGRENTDRFQAARGKNTRAARSSEAVRVEIRINIVPPAGDSSADRTDSQNHQKQNQAQHHRILSRRGAVV